MIDLLAIGYAAASITQILAGVPQIRKLVKAKNTEAISFTTWGMWGATQGLCMAYNIRNGDAVLIWMSTLWMVYYLIMIALIAYYRWPHHFVILKRMPAMVEDATSVIEN